MVVTRCSNDEKHTKDKIMSKDLKIKDNFDQEEYKVIRSLFDPSNQLSDTQIRMFLSICKEKKLDPRMRQICATPRYNKATNRVECIIITQIDGFRMIAEKTGRYAPGRPTDYRYDNNGNLVYAISYVKKMTEDGTWHEIGETAYLAEYADKNGFMWRKMPHVMLAKCAEARALRRAFPGDLSGLYSNEEISDDSKNVATEDLQENKIQKKISEDQLKELEDLIGDDNDFRKRAMEWLSKTKGITELKNITSDLYDIIKQRAEYNLQQKNNVKKEA